MANKVIAFRPNDEDLRILRETGSNSTDTIRRALRTLDRERWLDRARADAARLRAENLNDFPSEDWSEQIAAAKTRRSEAEAQ